MAHERSTRTLNMVYSQILFALVLDKAVWGVWPGVWSFVGSALVLGSAVWVAVGNGGGDGDGNGPVDWVVDDDEAGFLGSQGLSEEGERDGVYPCAGLGRMELELVPVGARAKVGGVGGMET